jgi:hypothetical protein
MTAYKGTMVEREDRVKIATSIDTPTLPGRAVAASSEISTIARSDYHASRAGQSVHSLGECT